MSIRTIEAVLIGTAGATLLISGAITTPAEAASFGFTYTLNSGSVLSGNLIGDLQPNNDTVFVSAVTQAKFNGVFGPSLPFVQALSTFLGGPPTPATVSFSGLTMNIIACNDPTCSDEGFLFDDGSATGDPLYTGSASYSDFPFETFDRSRWSLSPTSIPTPALLPGLIGMGIATLRKKRNSDQSQQVAEAIEV
jgi:hypothetical protein